MSSPKICKLPVSDIQVSDTHRSIDRQSLEALKKSLDVIGLQSPIIVKRNVADDGVMSHSLIAGRHRLEAARSLGWAHIDCILKHANRFSDVEAEMWEIAENLHRAELTTIERDEQVARWLELHQRLLSQLATNESRRKDGRGHRKQGGTRAAARDLGIDKDDAARAVKVAGLTDEAKDAARETGLDDNRSALLKAAKAEPEQQAEVIRLHANKGKQSDDEALNDFEATQKQLKAIQRAWNKAGPDAREKFMTWIDKPVMDKGAFK